MLASLILGKTLTLEKPRCNCGICGVSDLQENMAEACDCYKKLDDFMVHPACIKLLIRVRDEMLKINDQDPELATPPTCVRCHQPYKVRISYTFKLAWQKCLSSASVTNFMQGFFLTIIVLCMVYLAFIINRGPQKGETGPTAEEASFTDKVIVDVCTVLMVIMAFFTLWKVYKRWEVANSVKNIEIDV